MSNNTNLLVQYQALVRSHGTQFDPEVTRLQETVTQHLQNWQQQEQSSVEAQTIAIENIRTAIATDARWLLNLPELQQYIQDSKPTPHPWYDSVEPMNVNENPLLWHIASSPHPVQVTNYKEEEDADGYDDERTFVAYSYSVTVSWGSCHADLNEITTERIYGIRERRVHSLEDQRDYLEASMEDLFDDVDLEPSEQELLCEELSYQIYAESLRFLTEG